MRVKPNIKTILASLALFSLLFLAGCTVGSIETLYSLPQPSERYLQLQSLINEEIAGGSEYSAPASGSNRQSVQLYDLDGDGVDEAIAYFRDKEQMLKICIYKNDGGEYVPATTIQGEGTAIGNIDFADLTGNGEAEMLAAWQISSGLKILKVYSLQGLDASIIATSNCTEFMVYDITGDGISDLLVLNTDQAEGGLGGTIELFGFADGDEPVVSEAKLSSNMESVERMRTGYLRDMVPAVFIEGKFDIDKPATTSSLVTDILACVDGKLQNISLNKDTGISSTVRYNHRDLPYSRDIDSDRIMDIPDCVPLYNQAGTDSGGYWVFDWYSYNIYGDRKLSVSTYHASDGWYMSLPRAWRESFTVRRADVDAGERAVVLSERDEETGEILDFLIVYTLTGDNRSERARLPGRFILYDDNATTIYAAQRLVTKSQWPHMLSEDEIKSRFKIIYSEWTTGVLSN